jgi:pyruvate/2-oxoacid:ferredoxin oxidoreductase alpha subunit
MRVTIDGNEAAASAAYRLNEVCCIYPITPSSAMAELADEWSSQGRPNIWGGVPVVIEMQSEGGAAGALHGALQGGALATTFTASQGLLLMIPNMYKIAGELTPAVIHVAARSIAAQGLSIFGDHSDVMAVRQTGFALLASASVQEAHDLALVAQAATLRSRVPFVHFFDGFRTSHELNTIEVLTDDDLRALVPEELVRAHRSRALSPERPFIRGTAQNPDVYFQARETVNPFYAAVPGAVQDAMDALAARAYRIVEYTGHPEADRVIVAMGSAAQTTAETVAHLCRAGQRVGVVQVRLFRPFPAAALLDALPPAVTRIAVLDRTKEPGSIGEAPQRRESELRAQHDHVAELKRRLNRLGGLGEDLQSVADHLVRRSVWIVGGDGWAYDIGAGGLDHVLASGHNVNVLVLDTEVYSNTGGQSSKATPLGAIAKFAASGKTMPKKDLALQAIAYGYVYVARVAMGADPQQTLRAFREAEAYDGPSLIIAYSHCIAHGIEMRDGLDQQHRATASGYWPLIRHDPVLRAAGRNPFLLDSLCSRIKLTDYTRRELRYRALADTDPAEAERLAELAQHAVDQRWDTYEEMASRGPSRYPADARKGR